MLVDNRTRLPVAVVHDLVCPWCFIGFRRLRRALARRTDVVAELSWRPFLLHPDMPRGGIALADHLARKYGGEDRAQRLFTSVAALGEADGIAFRFDRIERLPSSVDAHRLLRLAIAVRPLAAPYLVDAMFSAHFCEGRDIGDPRVLARLADECGFDGGSVRMLLAGVEGIDTVHAENIRSHRLGISGVPCVLIGGGLAIAGAQEPEVLDRLIDAAVLQRS